MKENQVLRDLLTITRNNLGYKDSQFLYDFCRESIGDLYTLYPERGNDIYGLLLELAGVASEVLEE